MTRFGKVLGGGGGGQKGRAGDEAERKAAGDGCGHRKRRLLKNPFGQGYFTGCFACLGGLTALGSAAVTVLI